MSDIPTEKLLPQGLQDMLNTHRKYMAQANDINNEIIDREMKKYCTKSCFSNGSECGAWMYRNCDNCVKGSRYNTKNDTYTKIRCTIQEDIFTQYMGFGNEEIRQKSYDATRYNKCPHIIPIGTPRKKKYKVTLEQQTLFEL